MVEGFINGIYACLIKIINGKSTLTQIKRMPKGSCRISTYITIKFFKR